MADATPSKSSLSFDLCGTSEKRASKQTSFLNNGTMSVGMIFQDGVLLGAQTRATKGTIVADKNGEKFRCLAPGIFCCTAGTAADVKIVTDTVISQLKQSSYDIGRDSRVATTLTLLSSHILSNQGSVSAAFILGGVDATSPHLHTIYSDGSAKALPFAAMGSGSLTAMNVLEYKYREGLTRFEGVKLIEESIYAAIYNGLGFGKWRPRRNLCHNKGETRVPEKIAWLADGYIK